jgi:hypothetical protein
VRDLDGLELGKQFVLKRHTRRARFALYFRIGAYRCFLRRTDEFRQILDGHDDPAAYLFRVSKLFSEGHHGPRFMRSAEGRGDLVGVEHLFRAELLFEAAKASSSLIQSPFDP